MPSETIKDAHYRTIGHIETRSDGVQVAKDAHYRIVGYYDPRRNETKDAHYRSVGRGNFLSSLIVSAQ
jgi:hypothetical protein